MTPGPSAPPPNDPATARAHLAASSPAMTRLVERVGTLGLETRVQTPYVALVRSIISQQLSVRAAATIHGRLIALLGEGAGDPAAFAALPDDAIRSAGVSGQKLAALRSLAALTLDGTVPALAELGALKDDEVVARLTAVRGVGRWTVEMLLIFTLGRPDVWPVDDLAVRKGYALAHGLGEMPSVRALGVLGDPFRPYRSSAAWYFWRATELPWA